ncbi:MAG TPA: hypothetical protein DCS89_04490 [Gammaproteobacteria bacterium]|nr:hypothetical protein [Gammaproteobacteria bacterium]
MKKFVSGKEFDIINPIDVRGYKIRIMEEGNVIGSGALLRRLGADEGDISTFRFNLLNNEASIDIDSDETTAFD